MTNNPALSAYKKYYSAQQQNQNQSEDESNKSKLKYFESVATNIQTNEENEKNDARNIRYYVGHGGFNSKAEKLNKEYGLYFPITAFKEMSHQAVEKLNTLNTMDDAAQGHTENLLTAINEFFQEVTLSTATRGGIISKLHSITLELDKLLSAIFDDHLNVNSQERMQLLQLIPSLTTLLDDLTNTDYVKRDFQYGKVRVFKNQVDQYKLNLILNLKITDKNSTLFSYDTEGNTFQVAAKTQPTSPFCTPPKIEETPESCGFINNYNKIGGNTKSNIQTTSTALQPHTQALAVFQDELNHYKKANVKLPNITVFTSLVPLTNQYNKAGDKKRFLASLCNELNNDDDFRGNESGEHKKFMQEAIKELKSNDPIQADEPTASESTKSQSEQYNVYGKALELAVKHLKNNNITIDDFLRNQTIDIDKFTKENLDQLGQSIDLNDNECRSLTNRMLDARMNSLSNNNNDKYDVLLLQTLKKKRTIPTTLNKQDVIVIIEFLTSAENTQQSPTPANTTTTSSISTTIPRKKSKNNKQDIKALTKEEAEVLKDLHERQQNIKDALTDEAKDASATTKNLLALAASRVEAKIINKCIVILGKNKKAFQRSKEDIEQILDIKCNVTSDITKAASEEHRYSSFFKECKDDLRTQSLKLNTVLASPFQACVHLKANSLEKAKQEAIQWNQAREKLHFDLTEIENDKNARIHQLQKEKSSIEKASKDTEYSLPRITEIDKQIDEINQVALIKRNKVLSTAKIDERDIKGHNQSTRASNDPSFIQMFMFQENGKKIFLRRDRYIKDLFKVCERSELEKTGTIIVVDRRELLTIGGSDNSTAQGIRKYLQGIKRLQDYVKAIEGCFNSFTRAINIYNITVKTIGDDKTSSELTKAISLIEAAVNLTSSLESAKSELDKKANRLTRESMNDSVSTTILATIKYYQTMITDELKSSTMDQTHPNNHRTVEMVKNAFNDHQLEQGISMLKSPSRNVKNDDDDDKAKKSWLKEFSSNTNPFNAAMNSLDKISRDALANAKKQANSSKTTLEITQAKAPVIVATAKRQERSIKITLNHLIDKMFNSVLNAIVLQNRSNIFNTTTSLQASIFTAAAAADADADAATAELDSLYNKAIDDTLTTNFTARETIKSARQPFGEQAERLGLIVKVTEPPKPKSNHDISRRQSMVINIGTSGRSLIPDESALLLSTTAQDSLTTNLHTSLSTSISVDKNTPLKTTTSSNSANTFTTVARGVFSTCPAMLMNTLVDIIDKQNLDFKNKQEAKKLIELGTSMINIYYARFKYADKKTGIIPDKIKYPNLNKNIHLRLLDYFLEAGLQLYHAALSLYLSDPEENNISSTKNYLKNHADGLDKFNKFADNFVETDLRTGSENFFIETIELLDETRAKPSTSEVDMRQRRSNGCLLLDLLDNTGAMLAKDQYSSDNDNPIKKARAAEGKIFSDKGDTGTSNFNRNISEIDTLYNHLMSMLNNNRLQSLMTNILDGEEQFKQAPAQSAQVQDVVVASKQQLDNLADDWNYQLQEA